MRRIHKIKTKTVVKSVISDEGIEKLRDNCNEKRDLAIIDLLYSTGIRVGELVNLNIDDIDFEGRECIVYGKGDKERRVYFDAKAKVHLQRSVLLRNPAGTLQRYHGSSGSFCNPDDHYVHFHAEILCRRYRIFWY